MARPTILSLFSGVGGLELGIVLALGGARVLGYVERDAYAAAVLLARMEEETLGRTPVWVGNIQDLDGSELRNLADIVCGGIPCQPYSIAGPQLGNDDDRALWPEFARIVEECGPALVFIENVPAFVTSGGFRPLGEELCRLGYEIEDPLFLAASDVGAPHRRERVFILAHANCARLEGIHQPRGRVDLQSTSGDVRWHWRTEPEVYRRCNGLPKPVDELRCLGNAVVPRCGAVAFRELMRRAGLMETQ